MTGVLGLVAVSSSILTTMNDETYSWMDTQQYTLTTSPTHKYTFDSGSYYDSIKSSSSLSKKPVYYHQFRQPDKSIAAACDDSSSSVSTLPPGYGNQVAPDHHHNSMEVRQLEQDKLHYNAITSQARIHSTRASAIQKRQDYADSVVPPLPLSTSDHLFATYY
jgi:hypothetical protein